MIVQGVPENTDHDHTNPDIRIYELSVNPLSPKYIDSTSGGINQEGRGF